MVRIYQPDIIIAPKAQTPLEVTYDADERMNTLYWGLINNGIQEVEVTYSITNINDLDPRFLGNAWDWKISRLQTKEPVLKGAALYLWLTSQYNMVKNGFQSDLPTLTTDMSRDGWTTKNLPHLINCLGATVTWSNASLKMYLLRFPKDI